MKQEKGATEDEMARWNHRLNRHKFEQTLGDTEGQGSLACCSPWGCKESDTAESLNKNRVKQSIILSTKLRCSPGCGKSL